MRCWAAVLLLAVAAACTGVRDPAPWDGSFDEPVARPEHPRPDMKRPTFINLNTRWQFAYDPDNLGLDEQWWERRDVWTDTIQLPYAWDAPLSGLVPPHDETYSLAEALSEPETYRGVAWYRLELPGVLPLAAEGYHWSLVFGAVDFKADVWIDGEHVTQHEGGYEPFAVPVTVQNGRPTTVVVRVEDFTELNDKVQPVGKQGGGWYTRTSGIWQTVYLEQRPAVALAALGIAPEPDDRHVRLTLHLSGGSAAQVQATAYLNGQSAGSYRGAVQDGVAFALPLTHVALWDATSPILYDLQLEITGEGALPDRVWSYFGMVTVAAGWLPGRGPEAPVEQRAQALHVNGRPRYLRCVLDQSYYPEGVYTAPDIERMRADLELVQSFGFNCVRLHIKMDEPIKYRLLDELGFYVVYDIPSLDMTAPNRAGFAGREYYEAGLRAAMGRDAMHPSIVAWTIFNENWGLIGNATMVNPEKIADQPELQSWILDMVELARSLDARPVEDNSAGGVVQVFEHLDTDLNSFHYYSGDPVEWRELLDDQSAATYPGSERNFIAGHRQDGDPWWNSEFASYSAFGGGGEPEIFCDLFPILNELRRQDKLVGWVFTQLTDVEYELNGLVRYDRSTKTDLCTRYGVSLRDVFGDDAVVFDALPGLSIDPSLDSTWSMGISNWSSGEAQGYVLKLRWGDAAAVASTDVTSMPYALAWVTVDVPARGVSGADTLVAELFNADGQVVARSRLDVSR